MLAPNVSASLSGERLTTFAILRRYRTKTVCSALGGGEYMELQLCYGPIVVGNLTDVFEHQGTWFGTFRAALSADIDPTECRICEFITFCERFDALAGAGADPDPAGFDRFGDLLSSGLWRVLAPGTDVSIIRDAPNFLGGGEISWITA
jgi:hypothetical protein